MILSWRWAGSSSRFVDGSGWSCSPLSFLFLSRLCAHITPAGAGPVMDSFILSSFSWPPPIVRYHRPVPLPHYYQLTVVRRVSLAGSLFLHSMAIYFDQFARLHAFSMSNARAILPILPILLSFMVLITRLVGSRRPL